MSRSTLTIEQVLTILAETPAGIAALTVDLTAAQLHTAPIPGEWSANEVLAHLRSCADVWGKCMVRILTKEKPTIQAVNPTTWIKQTDYPEQEFRRSLEAYRAQRSELLAVLEPLAPAAWSRAATITGAGKAREWTVLHYGQRLARHERSHLKQFQRIADGPLR